MPPAKQRGHGMNRRNSQGLLKKGGKGTNSASGTGLEQQELSQTSSQKKIQVVYQIEGRKGAPVTVHEQIWHVKNGASSFEN